MILGAIVACFTLSGFAALLYQTAWLRQFSILFGTSELAITAILAAYMGGLAAGAAVAARVLHRIERPVLTYGVLEAGIAASALCVPLLMHAVASLYFFLFGDQPQPATSMGIWQPAFYLLCTFAIIAVPTGLMGATLPILIRHAISRDEQIGPRTGLLYAMNTAGAVAGTLAAGFWLLPMLGLSRTIWIGVVVNAIVFLIAAALSKTIRKTGERLKAIAAPRTAWQRSSWILPIMLVSGATAFYYELLWTRLLTHIIGGSVHAFATMLASFLAGIALGGGVAGRFASSRDRSITLFAFVQIMIACFSAFIFYRLQHLSAATGGLAENATLAVITMLPATIFIGATFPLAVRIFSGDKDTAANSTARVYAWNTVGAIVGSIAAGFYLISALGFSGSIKLAVLINLTLALASLFMRHRPARNTIVGFAVVLLLVFVYYVPTRPDAVITASAVGTDSSGEELFYTVGRSATVLVLDQDEGFNLRSNGLPEALIARKGMPPRTLAQHWLTALPIIARPGADSLLLVGLGGGVAIENIPARIQTIDAIELEAEIVSANEIIAAQRLSNPLQDSRVNIILNDARNAMQLSNKRYDIIVSQPSHPWTAGASHLYTREFMQLASEHLHDDGIFVQWMSTEFVDEPLLRSLAATLVDVFNEVSMYRPSPDVMVFLASPAKDTTLSSVRITEIPAEFSLFGINSREDVLAALALTTDGMRRLARDAATNTDDQNRLATSRLSFGGLEIEALERLLSPLDALMISESAAAPIDLQEINLAYLGYRLLLSGFRERALDFASMLEPTDRFTIQGLAASLDGDFKQSDQFLRRAVSADSSNAQARYLLLRPNLTDLARGTAAPDLADIAAVLPTSASAVVNGWRPALLGEWPAVRNLDADLAEAATTDLWFSEAARLRAEWRLKVSTNGDGLYEEALRIIDAALALYDLEGLLLQRATIALNLGDAHSFVETATVFAKVIRDRRQTQGDSPVSRQQAHWFIDRLAMDFLDPVRTRANNLQERLK